MKYKIPFGHCSCGCDTNGNNAGGGNSVTVVGNQARTYKLLTNIDKSISLQENMVAELDTAIIVSPKEEVVQPILDQTKIVASTCETQNNHSSFLRLRTESEHPFAVFFGCTYDNEGDESPVSFLFELESTLRSHCKALDFWLESIRLFASYMEINSSKDLDPHEVFAYHYARKASDIETYINYSVYNYLQDFPDMMNLDEILWYLSELYAAGFLKKNQLVLVPLTDRICIIDGDRIAFDSYVYIARFLVDNDGTISYYDTCGCRTNGDSIESLMRGSILGWIEGFNNPAFVFCQKRREISLYEIPITLPANFNSGGKATIMLRAKESFYLRLTAEGATFMPLSGYSLIWDNTQNSYILPINFGMAGTIELETIRRGNKDTILISEYLDSIPQFTLSDSPGDYTSPDENNDILDYSEVTTIYSSC